MAAAVAAIDRADSSALMSSSSSLLLSSVLRRRTKFVFSSKGRGPQGAEAGNVGIGCRPKTDHLS